MILAGNERYVNGTLHCDVQHERRTAMAESQSPIAAVLSCSDSRVPVEHIFDQPPGSIFVVRVAGNVATTESIASLEYAVHVLKAPLIMVIGHQNCGAVKAALQYKKDGNAIPGEVQSLIRAIAPALKSSALKTATDENAVHAASQVHAAQLIERTKVVAAYFSIATGRVSPIGTV